MEGTNRTIERKKIVTIMRDVSLTTEPSMVTDTDTDKFSWGLPKMDNIADALAIFCSLAVIFGGIIPYVPQYLKIRSTNSSDGFSTFVCLTLLLANILRIAFWFGHPFELPLLIQSFVMIVGMLAMMELCVRVRYNTYISGTSRSNSLTRRKSSLIGKPKSRSKRGFWTREARDGRFVDRESNSSTKESVDDDEQSTKVLSSVNGENDESTPIYSVATVQSTRAEANMSDEEASHGSNLCQHQKDLIESINSADAMRHSISRANDSTPQEVSGIYGIDESPILSYINSSPSISDRSQDFHYTVFNRLHRRQESKQKCEPSE